MATLDETNIFGLPLTRQYGLEPKPAPAPMSEQEQASRQEFESKIGSNNKFGLTYEGFLKAKEKKLVSDQRMQVAQALAEGDSDKAYEGFTELPMVTDQFPAYMTPVLGNFIDEKERRYFAEKSGRELKDPRDVELEMLMASDPRDVKQFTTQDPVSGAMSTLAGVSSLIGIGEGPSMLKAGIMGAFPSLRKGMRSNTMDGQGGGGGGISGLSKQEFTQQEIDTKARDGMFVSPLNKYLITTAPKNLKGQAIFDNIKANQSKGGYKTDEIKITGIENFLKENPEATTADAIDFISENKVRVQQNVYKDNVNSSEPELFQEPEFEPINPITGKDDSLEFAEGYYGGMKAGDEDYRIGTGAVRLHFMDLHADGKINDSQLDNVKDKIDASDVRNSGIEESELPNQYLSDDELKLLSEKLSKIEYMSLAPNKIIRINDDVGQPSLGIYGNDVDGYKFFQQE